jgi:hypothetical protein
MPPMRQRQKGAMLLIVVTTIMVLALIVLVNMVGDLTAGAGRRLSATDDTLSRIQVALVSFVGTHKRLPCPADPTGGTNPGWPDDVSPLTLPASLTSTCVFPGGVVPWNALGLSKEQVTDVWGRLISYRVYDGQLGLTQNGGASALDCDTDNLTTPRVEPTTNGLCNNAAGTHDTLRSDFITYTTFGATPSFNKGLNVHDFGPIPNAANVPNVAYVLISHGPSGHGGYASNGPRIALPASDARDYPNTQSSPSFFVRQAGSDTTTVSGTTGHFDDIVYYLKISDLLKLAKQDARDWPEVAMPSFNTITTANMTAASTTGFMSTGGGRAGQAFTPTDASGTAIQGGSAAGSFSTCTWWPSKLSLVSETTRRALMTYVEFAAVDNPSDTFPGFTLGFLAGTSSVSTTSTGSSGGLTITVGSNAGIATGMTVLGTGIATGATVTGVAGTTISLSPANTASVFGTVTFGAPSNITCGTNIAVTVTATGAAGQRNLVVSDTAGISQGMRVFGNGIPFSATVANIPVSGVGGTVEINVDTTGAVTGLVDFTISLAVRRDIGWAGGTLARPEYTNRFAVEFDATTDIGTLGPPVVATSNDPTVPLSRPHLAVDFGGVTHGTDASSCASTAPGAGCDSEMTSFPSITKTATGSAGGAVIAITDAQGMYGIVHGMTVSGSGIQTSTTVTAISGNLVTLSSPLTGTVTSAFFSSPSFGTFSTINFMQNGLSVFHGARAEIYPKDCYAPTATGTAAASTVTVTDASQLQSGMAAYGSGIGVGATVSGSFQVNLSTANTSNFAGLVTFTGGGSTIITTASGTNAQTSITVANVAGIVAGMTVTGGAVGGGATVSNVQVNLSAANSGAVTVASPIVFAGATSVSTTGTGASGSTSVIVGSTSGIAAGMTAVGTGLGAGARVVSVNATTFTVVLSVANASAVAGTLKFLPEKTLVKGWTLSNAGCNLDSALCAAMKNVNAKLSYPGSSGVSTSATGSSGVSNITVASATGIALGMAVSGSGIASGAYVTGIAGNVITLSPANTGAVSGIVSFDNRQMLQTLSCVPAASVGNAYDSLYFGLTTASRTSNAAATTTGSGALASNQITVSSATGILVGMFVRGTGIANGATVTNIVGTTLTLSAANTGIVSGTVTFAGAANVVFRALAANTPALP